MSHINVTRTHHFSNKEVKEILHELAEDVAKRYGATYETHENGLTFKSSMADGEFKILEGAIEITATLPFLMRPMKGMLETEINKEIDLIMARHEASRKSVSQSKDKVKKADKETSAAKKKSK